MAKEYYPKTKHRTEYQPTPEEIDRAKREFKGLVQKLPDQVVPPKIIPTKHDSAYEPVRGYLG